MSNQPQCPIEEIELIPHPLDAWRAVLDALIAVAPGNSPDIAWHLNDARERTLTCRNFSAATQGEAILVDRLMLLAAGKLGGQRLDAQAPRQRNEFGFTTNAPVIGVDYSRPAHADDQPAAGQPTHSASAPQSAAAAAPAPALLRESAASPVVAAHPARPVAAVMPQAPETLEPAPQSAQPAHQNPDLS